MAEKPKVLSAEEQQDKFSYKIPDQFFYQGVMYNELLSLDSLKKIPDMDMWPDDCMVIGYPKSGTTWLQEVIWLIQNDIDIEKSKQAHVYMRCPFLEGARNEMEFLPLMPRPRAYKTHIYYRNLPKQLNEKGAKAVFIARNPKDCAVSYYHFYRSLEGLGLYKDSFSEWLKMFMAGYVANGNWFVHTREWWEHRNEPNVLFIKYEDMKKRPIAILKEIATFLGKTYTEEQFQTLLEHTTFDSMKKNPMTNIVQDNSGIKDTISPFMRKGTIGNWKEYFSKEENEAMDKLIEEHLGGTGLVFDYEL